MLKNINYILRFKGILITGGRGREDCGYDVCLPSQVEVFLPSKNTTCLGLNKAGTAIREQFGKYMKKTLRGLRGLRGGLFRPGLGTGLWIDLLTYNRISFPVWT